MVAQVEIAVERHWYIRLVILDFSSIRIIEWHISSHHIKVEIWFPNAHIRMISQTCIYCRIMRKIFELYGWNGLRAFGPSAPFHSILWCFFIHWCFFNRTVQKKPVLLLRTFAAWLFRATNVLRCKTGFLFSFKSESYLKSEKALSSKNQSAFLA